MDRVAKPMQQAMAPVSQTDVRVDQPAAKSRSDIAVSQAARCFHSMELFGEKREVLIEHAGLTYRLNITQANKLILTK
jgi:hemin uptake protein HemP